MGRRHGAARGQAVSNLKQHAASDVFYLHTLGEASSVQKEMFFEISRNDSFSQQSVPSNGVARQAEQ